MNYSIRELKRDENKILDTFLYEAIFIPEGVPVPSKDIINKPDLQVYVKDFGENYPDKEDLYSDSEYVVNRRTIGKVIEDAFQKLVYNWNQPAGNRGAQSPSI